ncbi:MAG: phosphotransferase [Anaerolineae bacterium]|nr:phosphotransferase [Anaerolineae bacterium]
MITEAPLEPQRLLDWLHDTYGLACQHLSFIPAGECAWCYRLEDSHGTPYLLKLSRGGLCSHPPINERTIRAVQALYYEFGITQMPPPPLRGSTGQHVNHYERYTVVLLPYIDGTPARHATLEERHQRQLGALLGRIHRAKLHPRERPPVEDFSPELPARLRRLLDEVISPTRRYADYHLKFLQVLQRARPLIETRLAEWLRLQKVLRHDAGLQADFVVCHGDPTPGNLILTPDDSLTLIDWDAPLFAPRERDLIFVLDNAPALESYRSAGGEVALRPEIVHFYRLQFELQAIVDFGTRILFRRQHKAQNKHDVLALLAHLRGSGLVPAGGLPATD